jgi:hypothetical protein
MTQAFHHYAVQAPLCGTGQKISDPLKAEYGSTVLTRDHYPVLLWKQHQKPCAGG